MKRPVDNSKDRVRIHHMIKAIREIQVFIGLRGLNEFREDRVLVLAITKGIEIIGEAATKVSPSVRSEGVDIPWGLITAIRNRLIHGYFDIDEAIVYQTATKELPILLDPLERLVSKL